MDTFLKIDSWVVLKLLSGRVYELIKLKQKSRVRAI